MNNSLNLSKMNPLQSYLALYPSFLKDKFVKINLFLSLGINVALWLWLLWQTKDFSGHIPLHYNIYFGIDYLGPWYALFYLPLIGLIFLIFNLSIGAFSFEREKMLGYFLLGSSSFSQLILLVASFFIIYIN